MLKGNRPSQGKVTFYNSCSQLRFSNILYIQIYKLRFIIQTHEDSLTVLIVADIQNGMAYLQTKSQMQLILRGF